MRRECLQRTHHEMVFVANIHGYTLICICELVVESNVVDVQFHVVDGADAVTIEVVGEEEE